MHSQTTRRGPRPPDRFEWFGVAREVVAERRGGDRRSREPAQGETPRNPLKTHKTAKSLISRLNDFRGLRGGKRSVFVSFAKFSFRLRNFSFASRRGRREGMAPESEENLEMSFLRLDVVATDWNHSKRPN
jgi:hypothetical protein